MAQENRISITLKPEDIGKVLDAITVINTTLKQYLIALTPAECRELPKMSDGTIPFVMKSLEYAQSNPSFVPAYLDVNELKTDLDAVEALSQVFRLLQQLHTNLEDTITLSGSEAYVASLAFYHSVKHAAKINVPGAKAIAEDLRMRFIGQGKRAASELEPLGNTRG